MDRGVGYSPWGCKELDMTEKQHSNFINHHVHVVSSERFPLLLTLQYLMLNVKRTKTPKCQAQGAKLLREAIFEPV